MTGDVGLAIHVVYCVFIPTAVQDESYLYHWSSTLYISGGNTTCTCTLFIRESNLFKFLP